MLYFLFTLLGFVLGSTLFAYWIPKLLKNIDICTLPDDHNPGVSNAFMYGGFLCGILSLICELAKGFIPVYLGQKYLDINDADIINAIRFHTTGRSNMSLLEKIIFVADFTGDERNYDGVDIMREKALRSLEEAMIYGLQFTIQDLSSRALTIHPNALSCYNELILKDE